MTEHQEDGATHKKNTMSICLNAASLTLLASKPPTGPVQSNTNVVLSLQNWCHARLSMPVMFNKVILSASLCLPVKYRHVNGRLLGSPGVLSGRGRGRDMNSSERSWFWIYCWCSGSGGMGGGSLGSGSVDCVGGWEPGGGRVQVPLVWLEAVVVFWYEDGTQKRDKVFMWQFWEGVVVDYSSGGVVVCREESWCLSYGIDARSEKDPNQSTHWLEYDMRWPSSTEAGSLVESQVAGIWTVTQIQWAHELCAVWHCPCQCGLARVGWTCFCSWPFTNNLADQHPVDVDRMHLPVLSTQTAGMVAFRLTLVNQVRMPSSSSSSSWRRAFPLPVPPSGAMRSHSIELQIWGGVLESLVEDKGWWRMVEQIWSRDATSWVVSGSNVRLTKQGDMKGTCSMHPLHDDIGSEMGPDSHMGL